VPVLLVVLFQEDIRRTLSSVLRSPVAGTPKSRSADHVIDELVRACSELTQRGLGALIVIEQQAQLGRYMQDGVRIDSEVSWQLLLAMFVPDHKNPTHDGAVVIQKDRISAAACFLPLAGGVGIPGTLGSRHRAALGLADETDAVVVVVSEETETCALAHMGQLDLNLSPADLRERLRLLVGGGYAAQGGVDQWRRRIQFHADSEPSPPRPVPRVSTETTAAAALERPQAPALDMLSASEATVDSEPQDGGEDQRELPSSDDA
jgi:uncharacterized protein (TIGR00159 family)